MAHKQPGQKQDRVIRGGYAPVGAMPMSGMKT
jgi:hypothetical protein